MEKRPVRQDALLLEAVNATGIPEHQVTQGLPKLGVAVPILGLVLPSGPHQIASMAPIPVGNASARVGLGVRQVPDDTQPETVASIGVGFPIQETEQSVFAKVSNVSYVAILHRRPP